MENVVDGLYVSVNYTGKLEDGQIFDSSRGRQPLEIKMGAGQLIKGFERELSGMRLNDKKTFTIQPEDAYGARDEERMLTFPKEQIPADLNPEVGQTIGLTTPDGQQLPAIIAAISDDGVTVDLNPPLAGKVLIFEIEVVGISATPTQAAQCGSGCDCSSGCDSGCDSGCG